MQVQGYCFELLFCRNSNFALATNPNRLQVCRPRRRPEVTLYTPENVKKCEGLWRNEHSHSQCNSHFGRWSPSGLPKLQWAISRIKTQWLVDFYIIEIFLRRRCLKWVHIVHSDIWNTSYGQKKGWESNC
jgi:hypothetical protein